MKFRKYALWACLVFMSLVFYTITHENIHSEIGRLHGCIESEIHYGLEPYYVCTNHTYINDEFAMQEIKMHSWNEIIGYYLLILILISFVFIMAIMITNEDK